MDIYAKKQQPSPCPLFRRRASISELLQRIAARVETKWEQERQRQIREACVFQSPVTTQTSTVLQATRNLCRLLHEQAELSRAQNQTAQSTQSQAYNADSDYGTKRSREIAEKLDHHFRHDGLIHRIYQAIADRTKTLFESSGGNLCTDMVRPLTAGSSVIASYHQNVLPLPKKLLADLKDFLKFSSSSHADDEEVLFEQVEKSLDDLDYDAYLRWDGEWRRARPAGQCYPKRSTFFSVVISLLLNFKWRPVLPVQANLLSTVPLKISVVGSPFSGKTNLAQRIADFYGLCYVGTFQLYEYYLTAFNKMKMGKIKSEILSSLGRYECDIRSAFDLRTELPDPVHMELLLGYLKCQEGVVRGFVFDGFPATVSQARDFRNKLDGFDTDKVLETHRREKSKLVDDPMDPGQPVLPHCMMDLIVFLRTDDKISLQRLRKDEYRKRCRDEAVIPDVNGVPLDSGKLVETEQHILQLKRDCQDGLLALYRQNAKTFLELDGSRGLDSILTDVQDALRSEMQRRFDELTAEPTVNLLECLHETQCTSSASTVLTGNAKGAAPPAKPLYGTACLYSSDGPLKVGLVKFDLEKSTSSTDVQNKVELERTAALTGSSDVVDGTVEAVPLTSHPVDLKLLHVPDQLPTPDEHLLMRKAFRQFVLGDDPAESLTVSAHNLAEDQKKDRHKETHKKDPAPKKKDDSKVAKAPAPASEASKPGKGGSPPGKKAGKDTTAPVDDHDELGLPKPVRLSRKADLLNPLVKQYVELIEADESDLFGHPPTGPYTLQPSWINSEDASDIVADDDQLHASQDIDQSGPSKPPELSVDEMQLYFERRKEEFAKTFSLEALQQKKTVEKLYVENRVGAQYPNGYPIMRLNGARILPSQLLAEEQLLQQLDMHFPSDQEPVIDPCDKTADFGDSTYCKAVAEAKFVLPAVSTPDQLVPVPPLPVSPSAAPIRVLPASANAPVSGLSTAVKFEEVLPSAPAVVHFTQKIGLSKSRSKHGFGQTPSTLLRTTHNYNEICDWLAERWRKLERNHGIFARQIFHAVRRLQEAIVKQVDSCRRSYFSLAISHALHFEDVLYKWQVQFNAVEQVKRTSVQYKELLHAQAVDFHKSLTEDINVCRQKDIALHEELMRSDWLENLLAIILNGFVGLIQLELDTHVDSMNLLRDYVSTTEYHLIGTHAPVVIAVPFIELAPADPDGRKGVMSITPPGSETKKLRPDTEKDKTPIAPPATMVRPLTQDPTQPVLLSRKNYIAEALAQTDANATSKRAGGGGKPDRSSKITVDAMATRKHSKTQTGLAATARDDLEELMLRDVTEKAKEAALRIQEAEQDAVRNRYNTRLPEDSGQVKKPPLAVKPPPSAPKTAAPVLGDILSPGVLAIHDCAVIEETSHLSLRLDAICSFACMIISDVKKVAKALDAKIVQSIEDNYSSETKSAGMLLEYVHAQIENEEPIQQAVVFYENRFALSVSQFVKTIPPAVAVTVPDEDKPSLYRELRKLSPASDDLLYEDLQKAMVHAVEKSYGTDLVDRGWTLLDSDELAALASVLIKPKGDKHPDGADVSDEVHVDMKTVLKLLGNPPPLDLIKK